MNPMIEHMRKNFTAALLLVAAATATVAAGVAHEAAPRRVAVHTAGSEVPAYWNVTGSLSLEHSETAPHDNGGTHMLTVVSGERRTTVDAARVGRVSVEAGTAPVTPVTDKSDWRVLYGAQNTCGCSTWHTMHDGSTEIGSRVATSIYPGYPGSPGLGDWFWVIDLGREYSIASVGADFSGDGATTWQCVPRRLKVYSSDTAPAGVDAATADLLRASAAEPFDELHMSASRAMLAADATVDWRPLAEAECPALSEMAGVLTAVPAEPVRARYIKLEVEAFDGAPGDRCFVYEVYVDESSPCYTSEIADKSAWRVLYGTQVMEGGYDRIIDGDADTRLSTLQYDGWSAASHGNPFFVLDLGREYPLTSVSGRFTSPSGDMYHCAPRTMKVW